MSYSASLATAIEVFDIEKIESLIPQFPNLLKTIDKCLKENAKNG